MISPYYNRPTQEGIYQHYKEVAESVGIPIIVYNIPGRTGSKIEPETLARLSEIKNVAGVKEATGSVDQAIDVIRLCGDNLDRKSTRLNSSHLGISYAVFCLKKKKKTI